MNSSAPVQSSGSSVVVQEYLIDVDSPGDDSIQKYAFIPSYHLGIFKTGEVCETEEGISAFAERNVTDLYLKESNEIRRKKTLSDEKGASVDSNKERWTAFKEAQAEARKKATTFTEIPKSIAEKIKDLCGLINNPNTPQGDVPILRKEVREIVQNHGLFKD